MKFGNEDAVGGLVLGVVGLVYLSSREFEHSGRITASVSVLGCLAGATAVALAQRARARGKSRYWFLAVLISPFPLVLALPFAPVATPLGLGLLAYVLAGFVGALVAPLVLVLSRE
jgi:drug/metabolite transporter (DMT)-like permease